MGAPTACHAAQASFSSSGLLLLERTFSSSPRCMHSPGFTWAASLEPGFGQYCPLPYALVIQLSMLASSVRSASLSGAGTVCANRRRRNLRARSAGSWATIGWKRCALCTASATKAAVASSPWALSASVSSVM